MATTQDVGLTAYDCPVCGGSVTDDDGSWQCADCAHAPRHGAD